MLKTVLKNKPKKSDIQAQTLPQNNSHDPKVYYLFSCGCLLDEDHVRKTYNHIRCPLHSKAKVLKRQRFCARCGELFSMKAQGRPRKFCADCGRKEYLGLKYFERDDAELPPRKRNCIHYRECMAINGRLFRDPGACVGCKNFMLPQDKTVRFSY